MDFLNNDDDGDDDNTTMSIENLLKQRPKNCGILSFHNGIEDSMLLHVYNNSVKNDVTSILNAIDMFCWSRHWMMHSGPEKGKYLIDILKNLNNDIKENRPIIMVEIGSYCGYSSILLGSYLNNKGHLFCIEANEKCVNWSKKLIAYAGLENKITVLHLDVSNEIELFKRLKKDISNIDNNDDDDENCDCFIDLLFIDHEKSRYLSDLLAFEKSGLIKQGTIVVADNVLSLGIPLNDYLNHVKDENGLYVSETKYASLEYSRFDNSISTINVDGSEISLDDAIEFSICKKK